MGNWFSISRSSKIDFKSINNNSSRVLPAILLLVMFCIAVEVRAQVFIGTSVDIGNRVVACPTPPGALFKSSPMPSASVSILIQRMIDERWLIQYGGSVGILGYRLKAVSYDTTRAFQRGYVPFATYNTFHFNINATIARRVVIVKQSLLLSAGGGATMYSQFRDEGGLGKAFDDLNFRYTLSRQDKTPRLFVDIGIQAPVGNKSRFVIGLTYRYHFQEALTGTYNFSQAKTSGQLSVTQQTLSAILLVRISKSNG